MTAAGERPMEIGSAYVRRSSRHGRAANRCLVVAVFAALTGFALAMTPLGSALEEGLAVPALFRLRGPLAPPRDVAVVAIDAASAVALQWPSEPRDWPRAMHARLVETLAAHGAAAIVFDVLFAAPGRDEDDKDFSSAIRGAGNVVLLQGLERQTKRATESRGPAVIDRLADPAPAFGDVAAGVASFPLPKVPARVDRCWTFVPGTGAPTLPALALMIASRRMAEKWAELLASEPGLRELPARAWTSGEVASSMARLHQLLRWAPQMAERLRLRLAEAALDETEHRRLSALL